MYTFEYTQWRVSPLNVTPERKTWTSSEPKTDAEFKKMRTEFLAQGAVTYQEKTYPRTLVPWTSCFQEYRFIPDEPAVEDYDREAVHASFKAGLPRQVESLGEIAKRIFDVPPEGFGRVVR